MGADAGFDAFAAEHADAAPAALTSGARRPRPRRSRRVRWTWWAPVAAAAAVVAVVAGLTVAQSHLTDAQPARPRPQPSILPTPPVPSGYKLVSYHGIEFAVPATMSVAHMGWNCGPSLDKTVMTIEPHADVSCPVAPPEGWPKPKAGAISVVGTLAGGPDASPADRLATTHTTAAGIDARVGYGTLPDHSGVTGVLILSDPPVQLTVTAPTHAAVATILGSVRLVSVDSAGCPSREPTLSRNATAPSLAPAGATAISLCGYAGFSADSTSDFWLTGSAAIPADRVASLLSRLDALPAGSAHARPLHDYARLSYPDGRVRWLSISIGDGPRLGLSDGQHTRLVQRNTRLWKLLYAGSAWPEFNVSQLSPGGTGK